MFRHAIIITYRGLAAPCPSTILRGLTTPVARRSFTTTAALPVAQTVVVGDNKCVIEYVDVPPTETIQMKTSHHQQQPLTVVLVHGSPGTYHDFRHLIPLLSKRARVIGVNLPGFGASKAIDENHHFAQIGGAAASKTSYQAIAAICKGDPNVFILGHSFGGHTAIQMTKLAIDNSNGPHVKGMALLASAGHRAHQTLVPRTAHVTTQLVKANIPVVSAVAANLLKWFMATFIGFPGSHPASYYVAGLVRQTTTDYDAVMRDVDALNRLPTFYAWSKDDFHIEEELALALHERTGPGPRFAFEKGGHNIQKTRVSFLAKELLTWMESVVAVDPTNGGEGERKTPQVLE